MSGQNIFTENLPKPPAPRSLKEYQLTRDNLTSAETKSTFQQPFVEKTQVDNWVSVLEGIQEKNTLNLTYFSRQNVDIVLQKLRFEIWQETPEKYLLDTSKQSIVDLVQIMRVIYLEHSEYSTDLEQIKKEIVRLNNIVVSQLKPRVISQIKQHTLYLRDITQGRQLNNLPEATSVKGMKQPVLFSEERVGARPSVSANAPN